jgi:hypothetical protein
MRSVEQLSANLVYERTRLWNIFAATTERRCVHYLRQPVEGGRLGQLCGESLGVRTRCRGAYFLSMEHHDSHDGSVQRDMHLL